MRKHDFQENTIKTMRGIYQNTDVYPCIIFLCKQTKLNRNIRLATTESMEPSLL